MRAALRRVRRSPMTILVISFFMLVVAAAPSIADDIASVGVNDIRSDGILLANGDYAGAQDLDSLAHNGVGLYRARMRLDCVDPAGTGNFNFAASGNCYGLSYDELIGQLARRGITFLPALMNFGRGGVSGDQPVAPTADGANGTPTRARFAAFAAAAARRYGPGGSFWATCGCPPHPITSWEIWNEQNNGWWWNGNASASDYAAMFAQTRQALRSVDPTARAVVGGLIWDQAGQPSFVTPEAMIAALAAENANAFDAVAIHPYTDARGKTGDQMAADAAALVQRMADTLVKTTGPAANGGPRQQIWITEMGWSDTDNSPDAIGAALDAFMARVNGGLGASANVGPVIWYMLRDNGAKGARDDQLGLRYTAPRGADAGAKPAWGSLVGAAQRRGLMALPPALADSGPYKPAEAPVAAGGGGGGSVATSCTGADQPATPGSDAALQSALTCVVNAERVELGLAPLTVDGTLSKVSTTQAKVAVAKKTTRKRVKKTTRKAVKKTGKKTTRRAKEPQEGPRRRGQPRVADAPQRGQLDGPVGGGRLDAGPDASRPAAGGQPAGRLRRGRSPR